MRHWLRLIRPRPLLEVTSTLLVLGGLVTAWGAGSLQTGEANAATTKTVQVMNGLPETLCDPTQWHWIINQLDDKSLAPAFISVTFSTGGTVQVPLDKVTSGTAHYVSTLHLTDGAVVTNATAEIYSTWDGRFVLSCPAMPTPTNTPTNTPTPTPTNTPTNTPTPTPTNTPTPTPTNTPTPTPTPTKTFTKTVLLVDGKSPVGTPAQVSPGSTVVYQLVVTGLTPNLGGFSVTDHVPANTTFVAIDPAGTPTDPVLPVAGPSDVTMPNNTTDGAGSFTRLLTFEVSGTAPCGSTITNTASLALTPDATVDVLVVCP
jgi:hypothetical protein